MSGSGVSQPITDFDVLAAAGQIRGFENRVSVGFRADIDAIESDIWPATQVGSEILQTLSSAETIEVSSLSALDTSAGTGAQTLLMDGLDDNFLEIEETITMNGVTPVNSVNQYIRVLNCRVTAAGSTGANQGDINLEAATANTTQCFIPATLNNDQNIQYTVPANKFAIFTQFQMETQKDQEGFINLFVRRFGEVYALTRNWNVYQSSLVSPIVPPLAAPPKSDITMRAGKVSPGAITVACNMNFYLIDLSIIFT